MLRLAYFVSHPIQYQAPLLRLIAADPDIQLKVFFYSDFSLQSYQDPGFGQVIKWDVPLTEGYDYQFLDTWGTKQRKSFLQQPVARDIFEQLKQGQFDAVWVHGWSHICSLQAIVAAKRLGIPLLLRGEAHGLKEPKYPVKKWAKKAFLNRLFKTVAGFLYIGTLNRQFYQSYGVSEERLFPVPYAVDNDFFQKQVMLARTSRETLRKSLSLEHSRPIILYAAKLIEKKRPQDLLAAYRLLSSDGVQEPEPYLLFVGDGNLRSYLEAQAKATGWQSIRFLGFRNQSQIPALYDLCDVFVLPSNFEPWGLAVNEVMNAGKAVVVSNRVGCVPDLVIESQNGRTFPVGDIQAFAHAIRWALTHASSAGEASFKRIQPWSFSEDLSGLKASLASLRT
jgi:glycosyltransferase involved in cell wall biosynthesis